MDNKISNVIGVPIPEWLVQQFNVRSQKGSGYGKRDVNELQFLSNKTAWVRMVSSVNIKDEDLLYFSRYISQDNTSFSLGSTNGRIGVDLSKSQSSLAKDFILFAGTSKYQRGENGQSYSTSLRSGISGGSYGMLGEEEINRYGYLPMPGITSVTIETMGRMGSVRSATINFKVFDKLQLDIIDALYFKLGYTMLLEWGHTYYYKTDPGAVTIGDNAKLESTEDLMIDPFAENLTKEKINYKIADNVKTSYGNYDGMLGVVTNYNFTRKEDGSYECSVKIIGLGALAESMKINKSDFFAETLKEEIRKLVAQENAEIEAKRAEATRPLVEELEKLKEERSRLESELNQRKELNLVFEEDLGRPRGQLQNISYIPYGSSAQSIYDINQADLVYSSTQKQYWGIRKFNAILTDKNIKNANISLNTEVIKQIYDQARSNIDFSIRIIRQGSYTPFNTTNTRYYPVTIEILYSVFPFSKNTEVYVSGVGKKIINVSLYKKITIDVNPRDLDIIAKESVFFSTSGDAKEIKNSAISILDQLIPNISSITNGAEFSNFTVLSINERLFNSTAETQLNSGDYTYVAGLNENGAKFLPQLKFKNKFSLNANNKDYPNIDYDITISDSGLIYDIKSNNQSTTDQERLFIVSQEEQKRLDDASNNLIKINDKIKEVQQNYTKIEVKLVQEEEVTKFQSALEEALRLIQIASLNQASQSTPYVKEIDFTKIISKNNVSLSKSIFGTVGLYSNYYDQLISGFSKVQSLVDSYGKTGNISDIQSASEENLLMFYMKYGFNVSIMSNTVSTQKDTNGVKNVPPVDHKELLKSYVLPYEVSQQMSQGITLERPVYIKLGTLLMLINHLALMYDTKDEDSNTKTPIFYVDYHPETNLCLSSLNHLSTNPFNFMIPYSGTQNDFKKLFDPQIIERIKGDLFDPKNDNLYSQDLPPFIGKSPKEATKDKDVYRGKIMNVLIEIDYLLSLLKRYSSNDNTNSVYFKSFMENVLSDMCKALGNYNLLRLAYNDSANCFYIVDDQIVPGIEGEELPSAKKEADRYEIPLYGNTSIAKNLEIRTDISSRLSNMIAISANSEKYQAEMGADSTSFGFINSNFKDRYIPIRTDAVKKDAKNNKVNQITDADVDAAKRFNQAVKFFYGYINVPLDYVNGATNYYITRFAKVKAENVATRASAIIPVSVNFTTDGVSGFNMYQSFAINEELLPYTYTAKNKVRGGGLVLRQVGFCVVGLTHTIDNNQWNTSVKSNMIFLKDPESYKGVSNIENPKDKKGRGGTTTTLGVSTEIATPSEKKLDGFGKVDSAVPIEYRPLLDTIAYAEGVSNVSQNGYDVLVGFGKIQGWNDNYDKDHPNISVRIASINDTSDAAGRYQFLYNTWKERRLFPFNKKNQDIACWKLIEQRGISQSRANAAYQIAKSQISTNSIDVTKNSEFLSWLDRVYCTWVSLPSSNNRKCKSNQGGQYNIQSIYQVYIEAVKRY